MKSRIEQTPQRVYPYVITSGSRDYRRKLMTLSNAPTELADGQSMTFACPDMLDADGALTASGRAAVFESVRECARRSRSHYCIVWSEQLCTWLDQDGTALAGTRPPRATETDVPQLYESTPITGEDCFVIELPGPHAPHEPTHLCISHIGPKHVEIALGGPMILGMFQDPVRPGETDPVEPYLDDDGGLKPLTSFRGQPVTAIDRDEWVIYGPIQPDADGIILRQPFPAQVREACEKVAGMPLPREIHDRAWWAVRTDELDYAPVGVLEAR
jgi:hypothetical protein